MKLSTLSGGLLLVTAALAHAQAPVLGQAVQGQAVIHETIPRMVDPGIDVAGEPFSYASHSTDQLSVMYSPSGAELTPEGYLYTGFGELMFFVGADREPISQRIRTLQDGYLPIFHYSVEHDGLEYRFTLFAASLDESRMGEDVVNFVRVTVHNPNLTSRRGFFTTAWRHQGPQTTTFSSGDNRFLRPMAGQRVGDKQQPGETFNPASIYSVRENSFLRDGKVLYFFPQQPQPRLTASFRDYYNRTAPIETASPVQPTTPMATAEYSFDIPASGDQVLDFRIPLLPVPATASGIHAFASAGFEDHEASLIRYWNALFARGIEIETPEAKVNDTFRTSLVNDLVSLNKVGDDFVQTINQLQYHGFYLRDSADFVRMYDTSGYADIGRKVVDFIASRQQPDGNFLSQPGQYDGWGEALWTYGEHYRMTHDKDFAASVYPRVLHAVDWLQTALAQDPLHIMPSTFVRDNEYVAGHLTGYNFLALDGLAAAERMAHDLGKAEDEKRFATLDRQLRANFIKQLDAVTARTGGYIPPALDGDMGGTDWGNLLSLTPEQQLAPLDPRVRATLKETQSHYQEGLITYRQPDQGTYLHHYLTIKNTLTELILGEQEQAMREFYAELLHTSSTNAGWEYSIRPWGDRDFSGNLAPHGWFAAEFRNLLRNMMVREDGHDLHLLSAASPEWIGAGKSIHVKKAETYFGEVGFDLMMPTDSEATLTIEPHFEAGFAPEKMLLHIPWFVQLSSIRVDGKTQKITDSKVVELAPSAHTVELNWSHRTIPEDVPKSYADAVERYKQEYRQRYEQLNRGTGQTDPVRQSR
jgi:hypothetical protein